MSSGVNKKGKALRSAEKKRNTGWSDQKDFKWIANDDRIWQKTTVSGVICLNESETPSKHLGESTVDDAVMETTPNNLYLGVFTQTVVILNKLYTVSQLIRFMRVLPETEKYLRCEQLIKCSQVNWSFRMRTSNNRPNKTAPRKPDCCRWFLISRPPGKNRSCALRPRFRSPSLHSELVKKTCQSIHQYSSLYSRTLVTRTRITRNPPLTRTKSHFPWIFPHFSVIFTRLTRTRITRIPR